MDDFDVEAPAVRVEDAETGVRLVDRAGTAVTVTTRGWDDLAPGHEFPEHVDDRVGGRTSELRFPPDVCEVRPLDDVDVGDDDRFTLTGGLTLEPGDDVTLPDARYVVRVGTDLYVFVRFDGPATMTYYENECVALSFPQPTRVTLGPRSLLRLPEHRVTVPPTAAGAATAVTALAAAHETATPDRSFVTLRGHPPLVAVDDGPPSVPDAVRAERTDTGVELRVPDTADAVFAVAPLAHYVSARVVTEDRDRPVLRTDDGGVEHRFPAGAFDVTAGRLLRRVFGMDCLVRNGGPYAGGYAEVEVLDDADVDLDLADWYDAPVAARLERYLRDDVDELAAAWPDWQQVVTVDPGADAIPVLPYVLDELAWVRLPGTEDSISTAPYAAKGRFVAGADSDRAAPDPDEFEATLAGYRNRLQHATTERTERRIVGVTTAGEYAADVPQPPADRGGEARRSVDVIESPTVAELASAFECGADLLHVVGAWDGGVVCRDGVLDVSTVDADTDVAVLDAPGAAAACHDLVDAGVAVAVGRRASADEGACHDLVRAIAEGFAPAQTGFVPENTDATYRFVGAATHTPDVHPRMVQALSRADGRWRYDTDALLPNQGAVYAVEGGGVQLIGRHAVSYESDRTLFESLSRSLAPIRYDDEVYWREDHDRLLYPFA